MFFQRLFSGSTWKDGSRSDTPLSSNSTNPDIDNDEGMEPATVSLTLGVDENNVHPCEFCERVFSKQSLLKLHEQVRIV